MSKLPEEHRMTFMEHLEELRSRLFKAAFAVIAGIVVAWNYKERLLAFMLRPLEIAQYCRYRGCRTSQIFHYMLHPAEFVAMRSRPGGPPGPSLHFAGPTDAFVAYLKLSAIGGLILTLPIVFYQLWSFIAPGLYTKERRYVYSFVGFSTIFFVGGAMFGYYVVFPVGYEWFLGFAGGVPGTSAQIVPTIMMEEYLGFTSQMLLAFGVVFEMPLFIFFLSLVGIVTGRQLFKFGRYFTVIAFILAAILTPSTDVYSQVMLGGPLVILYFVAAALALVFGPKEARGFRRGIKKAGPEPSPSKPGAKKSDK